MLSEGDGEEDDVQWFASKVSSAKEGEVIFERRGTFVKQYCHAIRQLVEGERDKRKEAISMMKAQMDSLSPQVRREEEALHSLGLDCRTVVEEGPVQQLVELASLLGVNHPLRYGEYQLELDALNRRAQQARTQLAQLTSLQRASAELAKEMEEQQGKLALAGDDFNRWARRDCEAGVQELGEATETVCRKREEYKERLSELGTRWREQTTGDAEEMGASTLLLHLERLREGRRLLEQVQEALRPYNQLPPDVSLASIKLEEAKQELAHLMTQRDAIIRSYRM